MKNVTSYGFELEFFVKRDKEYISPSVLPTDHCGYLVEARADPHADPLKAVYMLKSEMHRLQQLSAKLGYTLELADTAPLSREFIRTNLRARGKNVSQSFFAYGGAYRHNNPRAGLHIHFGSLVKKESSYRDEEGDMQRIELSGVYLVNMPRILWILDGAFKDEISAARRIKGEYEIKEHGFEYRSLPATVNLDKVATVLQEINLEYS